MSTRSLRRVDRLCFLLRREPTVRTAVNLERKSSLSLFKTQNPSSLPICSSFGEDDCHAPIPDSTRMADPNRVRVRDYILGLIDLFFLRAELVPVVIQTISVITKIIFIYKKNYHQSGVHQNLYTYTESHLLIHVHFFSNIKHQRSRKQCDEHLSLSWPALLMWDVLSSILVFCFCIYTD